MMRKAGPRSVMMAVQNFPSICPIANKRSSPTNLAGAATTIPSHIFRTSSKSIPCLTAFARLFASSYSKSTLEILHTLSSWATPFSEKHLSPYLPRTPVRLTSLSAQNCRRPTFPHSPPSHFPTFKPSHQKCRSPRPPATPPCAPLAQGRHPVSQTPVPRPRSRPTQPPPRAAAHPPRGVSE